MQLRQPTITAVGCYVPPRVLSNFDLEQMVETNNQWILDRTGIAERHIAAENEATSDMAACAARAVLAQQGLTGRDIEAIILCTVTPDMQFPSTACIVQNAIGATGAWGFDISAACSGYLYGLTTGAHLVAAGTHKRVLVIGADTMSRIIDYKDRSTCILFGDGAGAMLIEPSTESPEGDNKNRAGFIDFIGEIDGSGAAFLNMPAGGSRLPASAETVAHRQHYVKQEGQQVFKYAVRKMQELCETLLERNGLTGADVDLLIPHQANKRIIDATGDRLGLRADQIVINIGKFGNTTAATLPLATRDAIEDGRLTKGKLVLFATVGAGYTAGAALWRWAY